MLDALAVSIHLHDRIADHGPVERRGRSPGSDAAKKHGNDQPTRQSDPPDRIAGGFLSGNGFHAG
jgi:hypothetical protein